MIKNKIFGSVAVVAVFLFAWYGKQVVAYLVEIQLSGYYLKVLYAYSYWIIPTALFVVVTEGFSGFGSALGFKKSIGRAFVFASIAVSPMFISSFFSGSINPNVYNFAAGGRYVFELIAKTVFAGFFEEYLFRGFLFGLLFLRYGWGFIPASILGALVFGLGHVYQGNTFAQAVGVFAVTAMGAVWFAWLYIEWDRNIWIPIFLHILMNASWSMFEVSENALGGIGVNVFRIITIAITVILTIRKRKTEGSNVNRTNLLLNHDAS